MIALVEKPARVLVHLWADQIDTRNLGLSYLQDAPAWRLSGRNCFQRLLAVGIVLVVILLVIAVAHVLQPGAVGAIPEDGLLNSLLQIHARRPSQFPGDFGTVQGITAVVPGAIGHPRHQ